MASKGLAKPARPLRAKPTSREPEKSLVARAREVLRLLKREYPEAKCSLDYRDAYELVCATILSAQCTDERVNKVTPALFAKYPDSPSMAEGRLPDIEKLVKTTGFFRAKALSLKTCMQSIMKDHGGQVPRTLDELVKLRGVGRKTANVVLGHAYGIPGLPVDTHVGRLARRLGFTRNEDPVKIEHELMELFPKEDWTNSSLLLIYHGRAICTARRAFCEACLLAKLCPKIGVDR